MAAKKKNIISKASPHTIKKFELIEEYIKSWAQKLLLTESCNGLIFIDCMCNSGVYTDDAGQLVKGTAVRVSEALREASRSYTEKNIHIYLNDKDKARVDELKKHLPQDERNFKVVTSCGDAHELLRTIGPQLYGTGHLHYFLLYDPYDATIDWEALLPFFRNWGEVMIAVHHGVSVFLDGYVGQLRCIAVLHVAALVESVHLLRIQQGHERLQLFCDFALNAFERAAADGDGSIARELHLAKRAVRNVQRSAGIDNPFTRVIGTAVDGDGSTLQYGEAIHRAVADGHRATVRVAEKSRAS